MEDGTQIAGRYVAAFIESMTEVSPVFEKKAAEIFSDVGIDTDEVQPDEWYDAHTYAEAMKAVEDEVGENTLRRGAAQQAENIPWPDHVSTPMGALEVLAQAEADAYESPSSSYDGAYSVEETGETSARVGVAEGTPYPKTNYVGVFKGTVESQALTAEVTETASRADETFAFEVSW